MREYILRRVAFAVPTLLLVSFMTFMIIRLVPGDVIALKLAGIAHVEEDARKIKLELGLDKPIPVQYLHWLGRIVTHGDFGTSLWTKAPIKENLASALPVSAQLAVMSMLISIVVALPVGILSAMYQDRWPDYLLRLFTIAFLSIPGFWIATLFLVYAVLWFHWSPPIEYKSPLVNFGENMQKMLPAAMILGITLAAPTGRVIRSQMLEVLRQDYVRTARAKGLREGAVVLRHALKNAMIPVITVMGTQFGFLLGGVVIMELIFGLPGLGRYTVESINQRDYPQLQANVLIFATLLLLINLIVDLSYAWFDPRIRYR